MKLLLRLLLYIDSKYCSDKDGNIQLLKQKDGEVKEALQQLENQDQLSIDEAVVTTAPLYRQ